MINENINEQEMDTIDYNLIIKIYKDTIVGDIFYPLQKINDDDYVIENLSRLCKFKE